MSQQQTVGVKKPEVTAAVSPEQQKLNKLMRELVTEATRLVFKVATCDCKNKDNCQVYRVAKRIAKLVDEISSLKPQQG